MLRVSAVGTLVLPRFSGRFHKDRLSFVVRELRLYDRDGDSLLLLKIPLGQLTDQLTHLPSVGFFCLRLSPKETLKRAV